METTTSASIAKSLMKHSLPTKVTYNAFWTKRLLYFSFLFYRFSFVFNFLESLNKAAVARNLWQSIPSHSNTWFKCGTTRSHCGNTQKKNRIRTTRESSKRLTCTLRNRVSAGITNHAYYWRVVLNRQIIIWLIIHLKVPQCQIRPIFFIRTRKW